MADDQSEPDGTEGSGHGSGAHRLGRAAVEGALSAAGALIGDAAVPGGAIVGAAIPPIAFAALEQFGERWTQNRRDNAARALIYAANEMDCPVEDVLDSASGSAQKEFLIGAAVNAAASTYLQGKIRALGTMLGRGLALSESARVDEVSTIVTALSGVEAPHIRLLDQVARRYGRPYPPEDAHGWDFLRQHPASFSRDDYSLRESGYGIGLDGYIATLERHGLLRPGPTDVKRVLDDSFRSHLARNPVPIWEVTALGIEVLRVLYESTEGELVGDEEPAPGGAPGARS